MKTGFQMIKKQLLLMFFFNSILFFAFSLDIKLETMLFIEKGTFLYGSQTSHYDEDEYPPNKMTLSDYYISAYLITNAQYVAFLNDQISKGIIRIKKGNVYYRDTGLILVQTNQADEDTPIVFEEEMFSVPLEYAQYPVIEVTWHGAMAYCEWLNERYGVEPVYNLKTRSFTRDISGFRLPTEAEWEKAAGWNPGEQVKVKYGFQGESLTTEKANYNAEEMAILGPPPRLTPVGYYNGQNAGTKKAVSYYGGYDFSGNVYEWCLDSYRRDYYALIFRTGMTDHPWWYDINDPFASVRGGSWLSYKEELRVANRSHFRKNTHCNFIGFRVVFQE